MLTQPYVPFELEQAEFGNVFELLGYDPNIPLTKLQIWDRLAFILSMAGLVMMLIMLEMLDKKEANNFCSER